MDQKNLTEREETIFAMAIVSFSHYLHKNMHIPQDICQELATDILSQYICTMRSIKSEDFAKIMLDSEQILVNALKIYEREKKFRQEFYEQNTM